MFSGVGAESYGGRFNSPGNKVVYTAGSLSLGILELVVQGNKKERLHGLVYATASIDSDFIKSVEVEDLPNNWDARPATSDSQLFGDRWIQAQESLVLRVPSVVVPDEYNYMLNPRHPRFDQVEIGELIRIDFDSRLIR